MSVLRKDPLTHGWVIFAEERFQPPTETIPTSPSSRPEHCPFCPGNERMTPPEIRAVRPPGSRRDGPGWTSRVVPNQLAILHIEGKLDRRGEGLYDMTNGLGAHEVIIETPEHNALLQNYPNEKIQEILAVFRERTQDLLRDTRFRYIQIFRNYGDVSDANIKHPHSQVIALPILPRWVREQINASYEYWLIKERCLICDIIAQDTGGSRFVYENESFVVLEPFAAKFPFETWIFPKEHASAFRGITDALLPALADALKVTFSALSRAISNPPYNMIFHSAPSNPEKQYHNKRANINDYYHWHIEILPRASKGAGFEYGTGFYINSVLPEHSAEFLRAAVKEAETT